MQRLSETLKSAERLDLTSLKIPFNVLELLPVSPVKCQLVFLYRPPNEKNMSFNSLSEILKACSDEEVLLMSHFNPNWLNKSQGKKFWSIAT